MKELVERRPGKRDAWPGSLRRWKTWQLKEPGGAERVLYALQSSELQNARDEAGKRPVGDAVRYIQARLALMNYTDARFRWLPSAAAPVHAVKKRERSDRRVWPGVAEGAAQSGAPRRSTVEPACDRGPARGDPGAEVVDLFGVREEVAASSEVRPVRRVPAQLVAGSGGGNFRREALE